MSKAYEVVCHSRDYEKWLEARKSGIGASDTVNERLIMQKSGDLEAFGGNRYTYFGSLLEPSIIKACRQWAGIPSRPCGWMLRSKTHPFMLATIDGWAAFPKTEAGKEKLKRFLEMDLGYDPTQVFDVCAGEGLAVLECKAPGLNQAPKWTTWQQKKSLTGYVTTIIKGACAKPPADYYRQVQHQLHVTGLKQGFLVGLVGGQNLIVHVIERNEDVIKERIAECETAYAEIVNRRSLRKSA